jgi:hypothetical protein
MLFPVWIALGLLLPAVLGGLITKTWAGVWTGLIWGGLVYGLLQRRADEQRQGVENVRLEAAKAALGFAAVNAD